MKWDGEGLCEGGITSKRGFMRVRLEARGRHEHDARRPSLDADSTKHGRSASSPVSEPGAWSKAHQSAVDSINCASGSGR